MVTQLNVLSGETNSAHKRIGSDFSEPNTLHASVVRTI